MGFEDAYVIAFCVVALTWLRVVAMDYVLAPWARSFGLSKRKDVTRFSEQGWLLFYCCISWSTGMVSVQQSSTSRAWELLVPFSPGPFCSQVGTHADLPGLVARISTYTALRITLRISRTSGPRGRTASSLAS